MIGDVVRDARRTFPNVVVVDDGSSDRGADAAAAAGAVVVRHPVNLGQGAALQTGFEYARSVPSMQWVVTFDADGQHQVADVVEMLDKARAEDLQVVFGSRFLDDRTTPSFLEEARPAARRRLHEHDHRAPGSPTPTTGCGSCAATSSSASTSPRTGWRTPPSWSQQIGDDEGALRREPGAHPLHRLLASPRASRSGTPSTSSWS